MKSSEPPHNHDEIMTQIPKTHTFLWVVIVMLCLKSAFKYLVAYQKQPYPGGVSQCGLFC